MYALYALIVLSTAAQLAVFTGLIVPPLYRNDIPIAEISVGAPLIVRFGGTEHEARIHSVKCYRGFKTCAYSIAISTPQGTAYWLNARGYEAPLDHLATGTEH